MRTLLSSFAAISILVASIAYTDTFKLDLDLQQNGITNKAAEADEWLAKGNTAYNAKDYDEAIKCYKQATALDPSFASAYYNLGIIYSAKGLLDEAISAYKKVLTIKPDYYVARNNLGSAYMKKGMLDEAISELKGVLASKPDFPHAHFNLGECYFTKGDKTLAADYYYKAGILFVGRGDKEWTKKSYDSLKKTNAEKLEKSLFEKINAEENQKKGFLEESIEITPKKVD